MKAGLCENRMTSTGTAMHAPTAIIVSVSRKTLATAMLVSTRWLWINPVRSTITIALPGTYLPRCPM